MNLSLIGAILGVVLSALALLAILWAFIKPWLVLQLVEPLRETRHQVTVNGHSSDTPTVLDLLSELRDGQARIHDEVTEARSLFDSHIAWSEETERRVDRRIAALEDKPNPDRRNRR